MEKRIDNFEQFWAFYLSEHRDPRSRHLHFVGTSAWLGACAISAVRSPVKFPLAMGAFAAIAAHGVRKGETEAPAYAHAAAMLGIPTLASPIWFPAGVVAAYGMAWTGHFVIEKNTPATLRYPVWSFVSDLRMWSHMVRGQLWSGDPVEELGLAESEPGDDAPRTNGATAHA